MAQSWFGGTEGNRNIWQEVLLLRLTGAFIYNHIHLSTIIADHQIYTSKLASEPWASKAHPGPQRASHMVWFLRKDNTAQTTKKANAGNNRKTLTGLSTQRDQGCLPEIPRSQSKWAPMRCAGQISLMHGGPTQQPTAPKEYAAPEVSILVPDTRAYSQRPCGASKKHLLVYDKRNASK